MRMDLGKGVFVACLGLSILSILWSLFDPQGVQYWMMLTRQEQQLMRELQALRARAVRLQRAIERARTDPEVIERIAREELMYVQPGEIVIPVPEASSSSSEERPNDP